MDENPARPLEGRVAIVTGGGRGIGRAYAERLAAYGARVVVNDAGIATDGAETGEDPAADVVAAIRGAGGEAVALRGDISSMQVGRDLCELAIDTWGRLDIVINNAGIGRPRMVFNLDEDEWDDVIRVHLKGTFAVSQPACRWWRAQAKANGAAYGRIVNTATGLLLYGGAGQSNYVAAKAGVAAFTEAIATEMAPYQVTANAIMPSAATRLAAIGWRMARNSGAGAATATSARHAGEPNAHATMEIGAGAATATSARHAGEPNAHATEELDSTDPVHVAEFGCYLGSPDAGWISGQTFQVRGATIEHVGSWGVDHTVNRPDRGWTLNDLVGEMPRAFGAGAKRSDPPPATWREQYAATRKPGAR